MRYLRLAWSAVTSLSTLAWLLSLGLGGLVITGLSRVVELESPWNGVFLASAFMVTWALAVPVAKWGLAWISTELKPAAARRGEAAASRDIGPELRTIRTIRGEIDAGVRIVESGIGVNQVYEIVGDPTWFQQRESLAEIQNAGDAYRLSCIAWEGFSAYNKAVEGRRFISDETLAQIGKDGRQAVDALDVAADNLR